MDIGHYSEGYEKKKKKGGRLDEKSKDYELENISINGSVWLET